MIAIFVPQNLMENDQIFVRTDGHKLVLSSGVLEIMQKFVQDGDQEEAGGILLGRTILDSDDVIVDEITTPMEGDKRSKFSFYREKKAHQQVIDQKWDESKKTCNYLGEWHTHPEDNPQPSSTDLNDWKRKLKEDTFDDHCLYFVIVGIKSIKVWGGCKDTLNIVELQKI